VVDVCPWFLGAYEHLAVSDNCGVREYDWNPTEERTPSAFTGARRRGRLIRVPQSLCFLGGARWSGLSARQQSIMFALFREQTRTETTGARIPKRGPEHLHLCPLIRYPEQSVGFNGNGKRLGLGYGIVGRQESGWLSKSGVSWPTDARKRRTVLRRFIADCRTVAEILDLDIVAYDAEMDNFVDLLEIERRIRGNTPVEALNNLMLRFYGPPEPHRTLEAYFSAKGQFGASIDL